DAAVALIPVEDQLAFDPLLNNGTIDPDLFRTRVSPRGNHQGALFHRLPTGTWETVLRRMDRIALSLTLVIPDVQARERTILAEIHTVKVVVDTQNLEDVARHRRLLAT